MLSNLYTYSLTNIKIVDGDTIKADIDLGFNNFLHNKTIRLYGINTSETTKTVKGQLNLSLDAGLKAKEFINEILIHADKVILKSAQKIDSFGRVLGIIYYLSHSPAQEDFSTTQYFSNLNELLVQVGYATKK